MPAPCRTTEIVCGLFQPDTLPSPVLEALRENDLLRQAISSGSTEAQSPRLGHRTVSSTQLASAARSTLTGQQRREIADVIRRQETLRKTQADSYEEQLRSLARERDAETQKLLDAEKRSGARCLHRSFIVTTALWHHCSIC